MLDPHMAGACLDPDTVLGWLDGQLSIRRAAGVEAHIDTCTACRRLVSESVAAIDGAPQPDGSEQPERLGPYEVRGVVGRGGMGEVYRAYDPRLDREVAVKVVRPASGARLSPADLDWFEREARAAAAIANPHVVAVFDVGHHGNAPYVVTELLAGETLRTRLKRGAVPPRQAIGWARELAAGMAAAHERGIVHRDLKPENVFITTDGRVKILDFGVAAVRDRPGVDGDTFEQPGLVVGTLGYMAPEQLRGEPVDHRTDIFAFGAVLFEMATGARAFRAGDGDLELAEAALDQDPVEQHADALAAVPWPVVQVIRRCLDKKPDARFQSAHDLAFALGVLDTAGPSGRKRATTAAEPRDRRRGVAIAAGAVGIAIVAAGAGWLIGGRRVGGRGGAGSGSGSGSAAPIVAPAPPPAPVRVTPIDTREGRVTTARFASDGQTVLASAAYQANTPAFDLVDDAGILRRAATDRELVASDLPAGRMLLAVSPSGVVTLADLKPSYFGVVGRAALVGRDGHDTVFDADDVDAADVLPDGSVAVIRGAPFWRLEVPLGTDVYHHRGSRLLAVRASSTGDVAFLEQQVLGPSSGMTLIQRRDRDGSVRTAGVLDAPTGLAWSPDGGSLLVSGQRDGVDGVYRLDEHGAAELVWSSPDPVTLYDVGPDGALLLGAHSDGLRSYVRAPGSPVDYEVSWRNTATIADMSADGSRVAQLALGSAIGWKPAIYVTDAFGDHGKRFDDVIGGALSRDGTRLLVRTATRPWHLAVYTIDSDDPPINLDAPPVAEVTAAAWVGADEVIMLGRTDKLQAIVYRQKLGAAPVEVGAWPLTWYSFRGAPPTEDPAPSLGPGPATWRWFRVSPDGKRVADVDLDGKPWIVDLATLKATAIPGTAVNDYVTGWLDTGKAVIVCRPADRFYGMILNRVDLATGTAKQVAWVPQRTDVATLGLIRTGGDGTSFAYSATRGTTRLYRVDGALAGVK